MVIGVIVLGLLALVAFAMWIWFVLMAGGALLSLGGVMLVYQGLSGQAESPIGAALVGILMIAGGIWFLRLGGLGKN